jgi:hypothetical protein
MAFFQSRFRVRLQVLLLTFASSGMADAAPSEGAPNPAGIRLEGGDVETGASPRAASNAWWLVAGFGVMALAALNSRKRLRQPGTSQRRSDPHGADQIDAVRKGR